MLSGDVHIAVDADLVSGGRVVGHEWTTSSVTSQNLADKLGWAKNVESRPIVDHLVETFPDLHWVDTDSHGFLIVTSTADARRASGGASTPSLQPSRPPPRSVTGPPSPRRLRVRVLVAPDKFAGHADRGRGRRRRSPRAGPGTRPDDELDLAPMSDGGPGFVDVLHAALGGELLAHDRPRAARRAASRRPCCSVGDDGVRRERPGLRAAPDRRRARRVGVDVRRRASWSGPRLDRRRDRGRRARRQRHQRRGRGAARRARRHRRRARSTPGRRPRRDHRVDSRPRARADRRASGWSRPPTSRAR